MPLAKIWKWPCWFTILAGSTALIAKQAWIIDSLNARFPGRGLWDYLDVFLVPILVFVLSIVIDWRGRARAEAQSKEAERIRSEKSMDQALQSYFDRISAILLDKQVLSLEQAAARLGENYRDPLLNQPGRLSEPEPFPS